MAAEFPELGDALLAALKEPDAGKRRERIEAWVVAATPLAQAAMADQLRAYALEIMEQWSRNWDYFVEAKGQRRYSLVVEAAVRTRQTGDPLTAQPSVSPSGGEPDESGEAGSAGGGFAMGGRAGPAPNDQRSDVMNPNNPAHQVAADNRSNQMNPNNPAYWSSRGGGRR